MDQLSVHRTREVKQAYDDLGMVKIENVAYSP